MEELELFILRIPDFDQKTAAELIDFFAFFLQKDSAQGSFTAAQIKNCFDTLSLPPYSNISSYLSKNCGSKGKYLKQIAEEMIRCYDSGHYNATLVLMRKLVETLIIECFEKYGVDADIKDGAGVFYYLSDLIPKYLSATKWNASRNIKKSLESVKKYGDLSAHNRRFLAKKSDIDAFQFELRQALQEIVLTINYPA